MEWYMFPAVMLIVGGAIALGVYFKKSKTDKDEDNSESKSTGKKNKKNKKHTEAKTQQQNVEQSNEQEIQKHNDAHNRNDNSNLNKNQQKGHHQQKQQVSKKQKSAKNSSTNTAHLSAAYPTNFYGSISLLPSSSPYLITCLAFHSSKLLFCTSKNQMVMYDLKKWRKQDKESLQRFWTSLDNNCGSAVAIGAKWYYVALDFEKTIAYYQFKGEEGVYFREIKKFPRNILKTNASSLHVSPNQSYLISAGSDNDTVLNIWSMTGDRLHQLNTYQIEHYSIGFGGVAVLVRGWTSEVKIWQVAESKTGEFVKIDKGGALPHGQNPKLAHLDNLGLWAVSVSKSDVVTVWSLKPQHSSSPISYKSADSISLQLSSITCISIHTLTLPSTRLKTFVSISDGNRLVLCSRNLKIIAQFQGVDCKDLEVVGSVKSVVIGTIGNGRMGVWNVTDLMDKVEEYQEGK